MEQRTGEDLESVIHNLLMEHVPGTVLKSTKKTEKTLDSRICLIWCKVCVHPARFLSQMTCLTLLLFPEVIRPRRNTNSTLG